jgi:hypothetical protein
MTSPLLRPALALLAATSAALATGCSVTPEVANARLADEERVVCVREIPTGTMGYRTLCRTVAEMRLQREAVQMQMNEVRGPGTRD